MVDTALRWTTEHLTGFVMGTAYAAMTTLFLGLLAMSDILNGGMTIILFALALAFGITSVSTHLLKRRMQSRHSSAPITG